MADDSPSPPSGTALVSCLDASHNHGSWKLRQYERKLWLERKNHFPLNHGWEEESERGMKPGRVGGFGKTPPPRMLATNRGVVFEQRISTPQSRSKQKLIVSSLRLFFSKKQFSSQITDLTTYLLWPNTKVFCQRCLILKLTTALTSTSIEPTLAKRRFKKYPKRTKKSKVFIYYLKFSMCSLKSWMQVRILTLYLG